MTVPRRNVLLGITGIVASAPMGGARSATSPAIQPYSGGDLQQAYDSLAANGGGTLLLPSGVLKVALVMHSRSVHVQGQGRNATILVPSDRNLPVLRQSYATANWDAVTISDVTIRGDGAGVAIGYDETPTARFSGRTILRNVRFVDFATCIRRPSGNIGLYLEDCQFDSAGYHIWGKSYRSADGGLMHNGVLSARRCHFQEAAKAVLYVDSEVPGSGQIVFDECTFENNPGFIFVFARFESRDGVPGISIRSCWNESNCTGVNNRLLLGGKFRAPVFLFADRVASIEFSDSPPGAMVLMGDTSVITRSCALDLLEVVEQDVAATLTHYDARVFGGRVISGVTRSLANGNQRNFGPAGAVFTLQHRGGIIRPQITGANAVNTCAAPLIIDGRRRLTTHSVPDAIMPTATVSQQVDMEAGDANYVATIAVSQPAYLAWTFAYRSLAGGNVELVIAGREGISTLVKLHSAEWSTIGGIAFIDHPVDQVGFLLRSESSASIRIGGYQLVCFPNRMAATEMINDGLFRARADKNG